MQKVDNRCYYRQKKMERIEKRKRTYEGVQGSEEEETSRKTINSGALPTPTPNEKENENIFEQGNPEELFPIVRIPEWIREMTCGLFDYETAGKIVKKLERNWKRNVRRGIILKISEVLKEFKKLATSCHQMDHGQVIGLAFERLMRNPYYVFFTIKPNRKKRICFMSKEIQECQDFLIDYMTPETQTFVAEDPSEEELREGLGQKTLWETFKEMLCGFSKVTGSCLKEVRDAVVKVVDRLVDSITGFFTMVGAGFQGVIRKLKIKIYELVCMVIPFERMENALKDAIFMGKVLSIVFILAIVVTFSIGVITSRLCLRLISMLQSCEGFSVRDGDTIEEMVAQAPEDDSDADWSPSYTPSLLVRLMSKLLGLNQSSENAVMSRMRLILTSVALGGIAMSGLKTFFVCLPDALKTALIYKFGTNTQIAEIEWESARANALALLKVSKIPTVLGSEEYRHQMDNTLKSIDVMVKKTKSGPKRPEMISIYFRLLGVMAQLEKLRESGRTRMIPFSMHICGDSGVGKTEAVSNILRDVFSISRMDTYFKPTGSEYWDGFLNPKAIVIDEFLVGLSADDRARLTAEYLSLCSSGKFMPNCASVEDPTVGIKGTTATPDVVVTINNTPFNRPPNMTDVEVRAFQRRRQAVIEMVLKDSIPMKGSNVDRTKFSHEEIQRSAWAIFRVHGGEFSLSPRFVEMDYDGMVSFLQASYYDHCALEEMLRGDDSIDGQRTPQEIIDEALRETVGSVDKIPSVTEALLRIIGFGSEGPDDDDETVYDGNHQVCHGPDIECDSEEYHTHQCDRCDAFFRHKHERNMKHRTILCGTCRSGQKVVYENKKQRKQKRWQQKRKTQDDRKSSTSSSQDEIVFDSTDSPTIQNELGASGSDRDDMAACALSGGSCVDRASPSEADSLDYVETTFSSRNVNDEDYVTAETSDDERREVVHQKDLVFEADHINPSKGILCDEKKLHRHICSCEGCSRHIVHKHESGIVHGIDDELKCKACTQGDCVHLEGVNVFQPERLPEETDEEFLNRLSNFVWSTIGTGNEMIGGALLAALVSEHPDVDASYLNEPPTLTGYLKEVVKNSMKTSLLIATVLGLWALGRAIGGFFGTAEESEDFFYGAQSPPKDKERRERMKRTKKNKLRKFKRSRNFAESPGGSFDVVEIKSGKHWLKGVGLKERYVLTYSHGFREFFPEGEDVVDTVVRVNGKEYSVTLSAANAVENSDGDWVVFQILTTRLPQFKDVTRKLLTRSEYDSMNRVQVVLGMEKNVYAILSKREQVSYASNEGQITIDGFVGRYPSLAGDCGSVAQIVSGPYVGKVAGIHVAGTLNKSKMNYGVISPILRDDVSQVFEEEDFEIPNDVDLVQECPEVFQEEAFLQAMRTAENVRDITIIEPSQRVHLPNKSKINKSVIAEELPWETDKVKPVLSEKDARSGGKDPVKVALLASANVVHKEISEETLEAIGDTMIQNYNRRLNFPIPRRELTFEEACKGIPGILSSIDTKTSPGYPLVYTSQKKGKQDFVWFDENGDFHYNVSFREMVEQKVEQIKKGEQLESVYLGYLKDELRKPEKVHNADTRVIWASNMVSTVAFRMCFGSVSCAFNGSGGLVPPSMGLNQYSHDMQAIVNYLQEIDPRGYIAGDYRKFDMHHHPQVRDEAYRVLGKLCEPVGLGEKAWNVLVEHETQAVAQIGKYRLKYKNYHLSGCFFTTIINCLVNEIYFRYCFARSFPALTFDKHIRMVCLGDDHIVAVGRNLRWDGRVVKAIMEQELGQVYTSADKQDDPGPLKKLDEVTYLGAHPVLVHGSWSGALLKKTLEQTLLWTRNKDLTIEEDIEQMLYLASQWDVDYFYHYYNIVKSVCSENDIELHVPSYKEMRKIQCQRTAVSGLNFYGMNALGAEAPVKGKQNGQEAIGITEFETRSGQSVEQDLKIKKQPDDAMSARPLELDYGPGSFVFRKNTKWQTTQARGVVIDSWNAPWELLDDSGSSTMTLQNMPFERHIYWRGDPAVRIQINGNRFKQGLLVLFFQPLLVNGSPSNLTNWTNLPHVFLAPNANSTATLRVPFRYARKYLNTYAGASNDQESLGRFVLGILSPLKTKDGENEVTISMSSAFFDSEFHLPRPVPAGSGLTRFRRNTKRSPNGAVEYVAEGANISTITNNVKMDNVSGTVPLSMDNGTAQAAEPDVTVRNDNPPLAGGAVPMASQFPSMSKVVGLEPTMSLSLHQGTMTRHHEGRFGDEMGIEHLCNKWSLVKVMTLSKTSAQGAILGSIPLNSLLKDSIKDTQIVTGVPTFVYLLNLAQFWKADFEFQVRAVRSNLHSFRLRASVGYGAPSVSASEVSVFQNKIMEFHDDGGDDGAGFVSSITIPYCAATSYLRTWDGSRAADLIQNYSLGNLVFSVATKLQAPDTVVDNLEILVFARLKNVQMAFPRADSKSNTSRLTSNLTMTIDNADLNTNRGPRMPRTQEDALRRAMGETEAQAIDRRLRNRRSNDTRREFVSEGPELESADTGASPEPADTLETQSKPIVDEARKIDVPPACQISPGAKFEYNITTLADIGRRHREIRVISSVKEVTEIENPSVKHWIYVMTVDPRDTMRNLFGAWAGTLKYRIFTEGEYLTEVSFVPATRPTNASQNELNFMAGSLNLETDFVDGSTQTKYIFTTSAYPRPTASPISATYGPMQGREVSYPVGEHNWIDVSVPFFSHFDMVGTETNDLGAVTGETTGYLIIRLTSQTTANTPPRKLTCYQSWGDDFRLLCFTGPRTPEYHQVNNHVQITTPRNVSFGSNFYTIKDGTENVDYLDIA